MGSARMLERRLAHSGRRLTEPRRQLIEAMRHPGDRFTAEQAVQAAPGVGRATVFRTMRLLEEFGVLCQVRPLRYRRGGRAESTARWIGGGKGGGALSAGGAP